MKDSCVRTRTGRLQLQVEEVPRCMKPSPVNVLLKVCKLRLPERGGDKGECEEKPLVQLEGGKIREVGGRGLLTLNCGGELHEGCQEEPLKEWGERYGADPHFPEIRKDKLCYLGSAS